MTATLESEPGNGLLTFNLDGSFIYTPTTGYIGVDTFTYTAHSGLVASNVATGTLNVAVLQTIFLPMAIKGS